MNANYERFFNNETNNLRVLRLKSKSKVTEKDDVKIAKILSKKNKKTLSQIRTDKRIWL